MAHLLHQRTICPAIALALAFALPGCSLHPLPEDVSRASTFDIVERVRCEVLEGLKVFEPDNKKARKIIEATTIGYDFEFVIEEKNAAASGALEYKRAAFNGEEKGFFLDLSASAARERKNTRAFQIIDKLSDLRAERADRCAKAVTTAANGLYPITGATGMAEVVATYVKLELLTDLARHTDPNRGGEVFSDELHFTTKLSAGATPTLELRTVAGRFRLSRASVIGTASRDDAHKLTVALTRGPGDVDFVEKVAELIGDGAKDGRFAPAPTIIRPYRTLRRLAAKRTGPETRVLVELQRRRNVREDERVVSKVLFGRE